MTPEMDKENNDVHEACDLTVNIHQRLYSNKEIKLPKCIWQTCQSTVVYNI